MQYITVKEASQKWGVTPRRVQMLCNEQKIQGAVRFGPVWKIPQNAELPKSKGKEENKNNLPMPKKSPFLNMTDLYKVTDRADDVIKSLENNLEAQSLFSAEIAYSRGEIDKVIEHANEFLRSNSGFYAVNAGGMLLALASMWKGDIYLYRRAKIHICEAPWKTPEDKQIMSLSLACIDSAVRDITLESYPEWFRRGQFEILHTDSHPSAKVFYIKYFIIAAQEQAKGVIKLPDVSGMGLMRVVPYIAEPLISQMVAEKLVIPQIYLRLLVAIAYHQLGEDENAIMHIDKAIDLALPDNLLGILAEHRRNLDNILDDRLLLKDEKALVRLKELHKVLLEGFTKLHNSLLSKSVSNCLTAREREVSRLAAFGLQNKEISSRLNIEVTTVRRIIVNAMNKTGVEKRRDLGAFV